MPTTPVPATRQTCFANVSRFRRRLYGAALVITMVAATTLGLTSHARAQAALDFCFDPGGPTNRFYLQFTTTTTTEVGTVLGLTGVHRYTFEGTDRRNPVTGTLMAEGAPPTYRLALVETGPNGGANLIWNVRLSVIVGFVATNLLGPYTVDTMPAGTTLTARGSGTMALVNCQTGVIVNF
jgi:hypothetical protein